MPNVTVTCDRCGSTIEGMDVPGVATSGFYRSNRNGDMWGKFMDDDEHIICDACMYKDARYIAVYGVRG